MTATIDWKEHMKIRPITLLAATLLAWPAYGQHAGHGAHGAASTAPTPYAGLQARSIKALSADETKQLLEGHGMRLALAAELNGYPGPAHVLELAEPLGLDASQRERTQALMHTHKAEARALGERVVAAEQELDRAFAAGGITAAHVTTLSQRIAVLQGELRAAHLRTHLQQVALLTPAQVTRYQHLRGYKTAASTPGATR
jgi:hypothetical protein